MLSLKNISKSYTTGEYTQKALDETSINFRKNEFVSILGPSGSGKTTLLNVIGGLDRYDSGDLIINGKSTENFTDAEWDAYRNNSVGFIFQNYNLISHLSILDNIEMGMTLSGLSAGEKRDKALKAIEKVGLTNHMSKKPTQLSGGQMQRVAIARALANDPDIILADEPTGALDTKTSKQIMDLIKEISKDKLVIMVTHNPDIAEEYSDRIIKFSDGSIVDDTNPFDEIVEDSSYKFKKTCMKFKTALKISAKNISTKKGRTFLTALASSIGIIGIALILALSDGFQIQIDKFQGNALNEFPIFISQQTTVVDADTAAQSTEQMQDLFAGNREYADTDFLTLEDVKSETTIYINQFDDNFMNYLNDIDEDICSNIGFTRSVTMNALKKNSDGNVTWHTLATGLSGLMDTMGSGSMLNLNTVGLSSYPKTVGNNSKTYLESYYDVVAGSYPKNPHEVVFVVDANHKINKDIMEKLGFDKNAETIKFSDIIGTEYQLIGNDQFYTKTEYGVYLQNTDYNSLYDNENNITIKICGIVRIKENQTIGLLGSGIAYSDELVQEIIELNSKSQMIADIKTSDTDVTPTSPLSPVDENARNNLLLQYGGNSQPFTIFLYPQNFDEKEKVIEYLDAYNASVDKEHFIVYTDMSETITELTGSIMSAVTIVLVAFASISLVVSLIMIAIITYISVLERTKEIGILRALGARKKDITRVFNAETFIIGVSSGLLAITISYLLTIPINAVILHLTELPNVAVLNPLYALGLITISVILTVLGGMIPAKMAASKDPVLALRSE